MAIEVDKQSHNQLEKGDYKPLPEELFIEESLIDGQGYYVKMIEEDTLEIEGNKIPSDFSINMPGDWFMTAYLHEDPADAVDMMSPIVDDLATILLVASCLVFLVLLVLLPLFLD